MSNTVTVEPENSINNIPLVFNANTKQLFCNWHEIDKCAVIRNFRLQNMAIAPIFVHLEPKIIQQCSVLNKANICQQYVTLDKQSCINLFIINGY